MLTDTDKKILTLEALTWAHAGTKETAIRERLGMSPTRYAQQLRGLLDREDALAHAPVVVHRLRRQLAARRRGSGAVSWPG